MKLKNINFYWTLKKNRYKTLIKNQIVTTQPGTKRWHGKTSTKLKLWWNSNFDKTQHMTRPKKSLLIGSTGHLDTQWDVFKEVFCSLAMFRNEFIQLFKQVIFHGNDLSLQGKDSHISEVPNASNIMNSVLNKLSDMGQFCILNIHCFAMFLLHFCVVF